MQPLLLHNVFWNVQCCPKCTSLSVTSLDGFWGCLTCRDLPPNEGCKHPDGACVYCGKPLIPLMEACLSCGNQPKYLWEKPKPVISRSANYR